MKPDFISRPLAIKILIGISSLAILFQMSVLVGLVPYDVVWGGRLKSLEEMYIFETVAITINLLLILVLLSKGRFFLNGLPEKYLNPILWFFSGLLALNTVGNLFAKTLTETLVFTPITFVMAWLLAVAAGKESQAPSPLAPEGGIP